MTTLRPFTCDDLWRFNKVNLDPLTETYNLAFYFQYLSRWPEYCTVAESASGRMMAYILGKVEGTGTDWHGHVTALSVAPDYRRLGVAELLMNELEDISENRHKGYFVDLFVRKSNDVAVLLYEKLGYTIYRTVLEYYSGENPEDAYDMRKSLARDPDKLKMKPLERPIRPSELERWT